MAVDTMEGWVPDLRGKSTTLVKVDTEGSEVEVLGGLAAFLARSLPPLIVELNPEALAAAGETPASL